MLGFLKIWHTQQPKTTWISKWNTVTLEPLLSFQMTFESQMKWFNWKQKLYTWATVQMGANRFYSIRFFCMMLILLNLLIAQKFHVITLIDLFLSGGVRCKHKYFHILRCSSMKFGGSSLFLKYTFMTPRFQHYWHKYGIWPSIKGHCCEKWLSSFHQLIIFRLSRSLSKHIHHLNLTPTSCLHVIAFTISGFPLKKTNEAWCRQSGHVKQLVITALGY